MTDFDAGELDALAAELGEAGPAAERIASEKMTEVARLMRDDARSFVPVDEGEAKQSIHVQGGKDYRDVIADSDHSWYLEFGTSDTPPQPHMWPAARIADTRLVEAVGEIAPLGGSRFR